MQRYGPPPSYPNLRVPGLNAPLPRGAAYGYHLGGWGKPPVDPYGRPLYGDVFGLYSEPSPAPTEAAAAAAAAAGGSSASDGSSSSSGIVKPRRRHWGEPAPATAATASSASAAEAGAKEAAPQQPAEAEEEEAEGLVITPAAPAAGEAPPPPPPGLLAGTMTPIAPGAMSVGPLSVSGMSGLETPDVLDLRKAGPRGGPKGLETPVQQGDQQQQQALYRVLPERRTALTGGLLGTTHAYVVSGSAAAETAAAATAAPSAGAAASDAGGGVAIALNPDELGELDEAGLARKYEEQLASSAQAVSSVARVCVMLATRLLWPTSLPAFTDMNYFSFPNLHLPFLRLQGGREDFTDLLEEQERKRKRKLESQAGGPKAKKAKDFKF